jgi:hypothetical protein
VLEEQMVGGFFVVIEEIFLPVFLGVAILATGSEDALMFIVLLVAGNARGLQLAFDPVILVAAGAFGLLMPEQQTIGGYLVVVEQGLSPVPFNMAVIASCSEDALMQVILLVAGDTQFGRFLVFLVRVALNTLCSIVPSN